MRFSHRFFLYAPFALVVLVALAAGAWWWVASRAVSNYLDASNGHAIAPGVTLHFTGKQIAGFPFRVDAILDNAQIDVATSQGPASWRSEHFAMHALTYGPRQAIYEAAGQQTLRWTGLDGKPHVWTFTPTVLRASSYNQSTGPNSGLARFDLDAIAIRSPELNADRFQFHLRRNPKRDGLDIVVTGQGIHLSPALQAGFGDTIRTLHLDASAVPATPLTALLGGKRDWRASLENWRGHGGAFTLNALGVDWNTLKASATGQLSLDAQHRPAGLLKLNLDGVQSLAAGLARLGLAQGDNNGLAPALLMMAEASNAQIQLSADVGFQDGIVTVGGTPAGVLRPIY
ncbi:MAG TPA: DUF2125 domain-containing protein [Rhizomicrobium sp.]|jgi:hypothetical protein|nr:DUF2125 domain-containing protein [Rhizomicrobium sp.]